MNILSLFDGISGARVALDELGISCTYNASEIDKHSITISNSNYPDIIRLGDVKNVGVLDVDLLIGGSPCQDLSISNTKGRKGLDGARSSLFYEYLRVLKLNNPKYFLLENVGTMADKDKATITNELGVEPFFVNSKSITAQSRGRYYWLGVRTHNGYKRPQIPFLQPVQQHLMDIMDVNVVSGVKFLKDTEVVPTGFLQHYTNSYNDGIRFNRIKRLGKIGTGRQSGGRAYAINSKSATLTTGTGEFYAIPMHRSNPKYKHFKQQNLITKIQGFEFVLRKLTVGESCQLQGFKTDYCSSSSVPIQAKYDGVGNSFTVPVIKHFIEYMLRI